MLDLLIINGSCPDYEAGEMKQTNIGLKSGKIAWMGAEGEELPEAAEVIDAAGKVVSPGFIDIHMHEEKFLKEGKKYSIGEMMLDMGVTTVVGGNCGEQYQSLAEFKAVVEELGGAPVNYVMLAGYNTFRTKLESDAMNMRRRNRWNP